MDIHQYCISLRKKIVVLVTGIHNAGFSLYWDNTTPNHITKRKLQRVYDQYFELAAEFGIFLVTRHTNCSYKNHELADAHFGYMCSNKYNKNISYRDPEYIWDGAQMYQGSRVCICPCSPEKEPKEHWIIEDIIYSKDADLTKARSLYSILSDIYCAIEQSGDKQPRSGIREYLLRAILQLNDMILPTTVEDYIESTAHKSSK